MGAKGEKQSGQAARKQVNLPTTARLMPSPSVPPSPSHGPPHSAHARARMNKWLLCGYSVSQPPCGPGSLQFVVPPQVFVSASRRASTNPVRISIVLLLATGLRFEPMHEPVGVEEPAHDSSPSIDSPEARESRTGTVQGGEMPFP
jgi:hypothetical protein